MAQLHADGQPEGTALAVTHRARAGLLWWHNRLSPVLVMLPCGGFHVPPHRSCGSVACGHGHTEELGFLAAGWAGIYQSW